MRKTLALFLALLAVLAALTLTACAPTMPGTDPEQDETDPGTDQPPALTQENSILLTEEELRDRITASWIAQMVGVSWAASTEFRFNNTIMPESQMPTWNASMVNDAFGQDDLYVEIPFIDAMKDQGIDCSMEVMGQYFADSTFSLAHANLIGRENIRNGISAAEAGHYKNNWHADDIDWQIEADFVGNIYPGYPTAAANKSFDIGHLMNYGDGVYGGVWVAAMHAAAFNAKDLREVIDISLAAIPEGTKFRTVLEEVITAYDSGVAWETLWQQLEDKWGYDDKCPECQGGMNIDAKLNAAYVLIGLLYGESDFEQTILISTRCGQDSDCNPSTAAAVLGTLYGLDWIPERYRSGVDYNNTNFAYTEYSLNECIDICVDLAKTYLDSTGTATEGGWLIPNTPTVEPVPFEQWPDDEITAYLTVTPKADGYISIQLLYVAPEEVSITMDMGDGMVIKQAMNSYRYLTAGTYTVTCTVSDASGRSCTVERTFEATGTRPFNMTASASNANPQGGGSRDPGVMCDGVVTNSDNAQQYDTYPGTAGADTWFALSFDREVTVSKIFFTEGAHFDNGGWFVKAPVAELLIDGEWVACEYELSPLYIEVNGMSAQGNPYETFTYTLKTPTACDGIRVRGTAGGSQYFASCAELDVAYTHVEDPIVQNNTGDIVADALPIVSVTSPTGAGCKDLEVMRDGYIPQSGESHTTVQYDTFTGSTTDREDYFGYMFRYACRVTSITYTEGSHFDNGGWFKNGSIRVEALIDGEWVEVESTCSPSYPNGDTQGAFGQSFSTYTFTLSEETLCTGIRIIGDAGGSAHFTSVSELSVEGKKAD